MNVASTRVVHGIHLAILAGYLAGLVLAWPRLPEQVPTHFDLSGTPDAWSDRSALAWFGPFIVALGLALMMAAVPGLAKRSPHLWNVPEKKRFVALPPHLRAGIEARLERFLAVAGVLTTLLFIGIQVGMYQTAVGEVPDLPRYLLGFMLAIILAIIGLAYRESRIAAREIRRLTS